MHKLIGIFDMQLSDDKRCYLQRIEPWNISAWEACCPMIQDAIDSCDEPYALPDIKIEIDNNRMQLWAIFSKNNEIQASFVTSIAYNGRVLIIFFAGGEGIGDWLNYFNELMRWGKDNGCSSCEVHGRLGWDKVLKPYGFRRKKVVLEREL